MAVIENLDVVLGAKTEKLDKEIDKELKALDSLRQKANENKLLEMQIDAELRRAEQARNNEKEAIRREADARRAMSDRRHEQLLKEGIALKQSVATGEERHAEAVRRYSMLRDRGNISQETYNRLVQKSIELNFKLEQSQSSQRMAAYASRLPTGGGGMAESIGMAGIASRFAGPGALALGVAQSFRLAAGVETASTAFEVLLGSAGAAKEMIADMKRLDAESPVGFQDFQVGGKTLMGYGMAAGNIIPTLEALSQVSMGNSEKMKLMALAVGQVNALGRLQATELRQLTEHGFNPLENIAKRYNITMEEAMQRMGDGKVSADMFNQALQDAVGVGGRFAGMNEKLAKTGAGVFSKMASEAQILGANLGGVLMPVGKLLAGTAKLSMSGWNQIFDLGKAFFGPSLNERIEQARKEAADLAKSMDDAANASKAMESNLARVPLSIKSANQLWAEEAGGEKFQDKIAQIDEQYRRMIVGEERFNQVQLEGLLKNNDLSAEDKAKGLEALRQKEAIEEKKKFEEKKKAEQDAASQKAKEAEEALKKDREAALQMKKGLGGPEAALRDKIDEIKRLKDKGLLNESEALRLGEKAVNESGIAKKPENVGAVSAQAGSVEAYKLMLGRENERRKGEIEAQQKRILMVQYLASIKTSVAGIKPTRAAR